MFLRWVLLQISCDENVGREVAIDRVGVGMRPEMTTMLTDNWRIGALTSFLLPLFLSLKHTHCPVSENWREKIEPDFKTRSIVSVGALSKEPNELGEIPRGIQRAHEMKEK